MNLKDKQLLRDLAKRFAEITNSREMDKRRERWYAHNDLREGPPLILMFPEGSWNEILTDDDLVCEDTQARNYEHTLRTNIYWHDVIADDAAQECRYYVWPSFDMGSYGAEPTYTYGEDRGSFRWEHPLKNLDEDFRLLSMPEPVFDREETQRRLDAANDVFGGILEVTLRRNLDGWTLGMTGEVIRLIGMDNLFMAMYDNPDGLHRLMAFMRDAKLKLLDTYEREEGLMPPNDRDGYTGSGGQAYTHNFDRKAASPLMRCWGFAESQETVGVSPAMFNEFVFQYQLPLLERFGLNCYGCCEPVHERLKYILQIPRIRRVSVSPWCDQRIAAEALGRKIVYSRKPNPAHICASFNEEAARADIAGTLEAARGCNIELIMKDTHTLQHEPWRAGRWVKIAREEIAKRF